MPPARWEPDADPVFRTVQAHTGAYFEGQLLNRQRGQQLEGVEVRRQREAVPPQHNIEQPALRPVAAAGGAAQEQAPLPHDREPVPEQQPDQEPAAATRVLVVGASTEDVSKSHVKKAWKARLRELAGKPPFNYMLVNTTITLKVLADGQLSCAEL